MQPCRNQLRVLTAATALAAGCLASACERQTTTAEPVDLQSVLIPAGQQPTAGQLNPAVTLKDAVEKRMLGAMDPDGLLIAPFCIKYLNAIGDIGSFEGWLQSGTRKAGGTFFHLIARIPSGSAIEKIKASTAVCNVGSMTLRSTISGRLSYAQSQAPAILGATTFQLAQSIEFPVTHDPEAQQALKDFGFAGPDGTLAAGGGTCDGIALMLEVAVNPSETLFMWILEPNVELAKQVGAAMVARVSSSRVAASNSTARDRRARLEVASLF